MTTGDTNTGVTPTYKVREIRPGDAEAYRSILERTTEEDRYCRFFHAVDHFDEAEIQRFVDPGQDTLGFIAEDAEHALGVAHAMRIGPDRAELAIVVASDARHVGVGTALFAHLLKALPNAGFRRLVAYALVSNPAFPRLALQAGMVPHKPCDGIVTWTLTLDGPVV